MHFVLIILAVACVLHWQNFKCNFGDACSFSHDCPGGPSERGIYPGLKLNPLMSQLVGDRGPHEQHGEGDFYQTPAAAPQYNPAAPICKHFLAGRCNFESCRFSHETDQPGAGISPLGPYHGIKGKGKGDVGLGSDGGGMGSDGSGMGVRWGPY